MAVVTQVRILVTAHFFLKTSIVFFFPFSILFLHSWGFADGSVHVRTTHVLVRARCMGCIHLHMRWGVRHTFRRIWCAEILLMESLKWKRHSNTMVSIGSAEEQCTENKNPRILITENVVLLQDWR